MRLRFLVPACVIVAACAGSDDAPSAAIVRDSAGIQIVDNSAPSWRAGEEWTLSAEPVLDIGSVDGNPDYEFGSAHAPVRLADGRIVVADMMTNYMSFYDASGSFLMRAGGSGEGPGEFEQLYRMKKISGDSLMGLNPATLTSIFTPDGRYIRRFELDPVDRFGNIWWLGRLEGGVLLAHSLQREGTRMGPGDDNHEYRLEIPDKPPFYRDSTMHFLYDMDGRMIDSIGRLPSQYLGEERTLAPNAAYAFEGSTFHHSPGNITEIRSFQLASQESGVAAEERPSARLRLTRIVRLTPQHDLTVTDALKARHIAAERTRYERMYESTGRKFEEPMFQRMVERMVFPPAMPAHGNRMYVSADGYLWLQDYVTDPDSAYGWSIIDPEGSWLGTVRTPARFTLNEVGTDYVLGIWRDSLDVQHIRMYSLNRPAAGRR